MATKKKTSTRRASKKTEPKKTTAKKTTAKKTAPKRGGAREGAGRKPLLGSKMEAGVYVRCSQEQKEALETYIEALNEKRKAAGYPGKVSLSTWLRELALKHSDNEQLGAAARARAEAEAASSIV